MTRARDLARIANSNALTIDSSGNVGIGSTVPTSKLSVVGVVSATSFSGNVTGTATGLSGTPNITVGTIAATSLNASGVVTATSFVGSGANLTGVISGVEIKSAGSSVGTGITNINFVGATATATGSASTITITVTASFNELDVALFS
jgi:hypothetical protein